MNYEAYPVQIDKENTRFQFQSVGKRGIFEKVVLITPLLEQTFNLALLDYDALTGKYNDLSVTDNGDMREILATVINIIQRFLSIYPNRKLYFEGSTPSRNRLYQMSINKIYDSIRDDVTIFGLKDDEWFMFEANSNFEGFLIEKL